MSLKKLAKLSELAATDFDAACEMAEQIPAIAEFFDTWAKHCGASRKVFVGHTVVMLVSLTVSTDETA